MIRRAAACVALALSAGAWAAEFGAIGTAGAVLYDAPSASAHKVAVAPRGMPIELLSVVNPWVKARDLTGQSFWVERRDVVRQRTVIATMVATVRGAAQDDAAALFQVERGVVLDLVEAAPSPGWARVRHQDGTTGFVRAREVWGL